MNKEKIRVKHKDVIYQELLYTYKKCLNRKVRPAISDEDYGYGMALEWVLGLPITTNKEGKK
tara:strand:- start:319 stop:504 length:186 start_codon:yes stop_codon:yes gene_type:complete